MASFMGVSFVPTKEGALVYFEAIDPNAVAAETGQFFHWQGYRLEEGHTFVGIYGKGSVAGRVFAGGFADRTKIAVRIEPENQYCRLTVAKAMSGMGGGILGYHKMNKELERLRHALYGFFMTSPQPVAYPPQPMMQPPPPGPPQPMMQPPQPMMQPPPPMMQPPPPAAPPPETSYTVGRSADMDICVEDALVSGYQARLINIADQWYIEDSGASTGTYVNGQPLVIRTAVGPTDQIGLGGYTVTLPQLMALRRR